MKSIISLIFAALVFLGAAPAFGQTITFYPVSAPNPTGPSTSGWRANALSALQNGVLTWGTPGTPTYFDATDSTISVSEIIQTSAFNSWKGYADPENQFGANYANELGNAFRMIFVIQRGASQFTLSQLSGTTTLSGPFSSTAPITVGSHNGSTIVGVNYGTNGLFGGGDDTYVTSGNSAPLDALIFQAAVNTFAVSPTGLDEQIRLNNTFANLDGLSITTTVSLNGIQIGQYTQAFESADAIAIAEPWEWALLGVFAAGLVCASRTGLLPSFFG